MLSITDYSFRFQSKAAQTHRDRSRSTLSLQCQQLVELNNAILIIRLPRVYVSSQQLIYVEVKQFSCSEEIRWVLQGRIYLTAFVVGIHVCKWTESNSSILIYA